MSFEYVNIQFHRVVGVESRGVAMGGGGLAGPGPP